MFRCLASLLAVLVLCLVPVTAFAGGPFQKLAIQKAPVQKTFGHAVQKAPIDVVQKVPMPVLQKGPMPVYQKSPMPAVQKLPMTVVQKSYGPKMACVTNVRYVQRRPCKKRTCCGCTPSIQTMLQVQDPRGCGSCPVLVPVCIPGCCAGAPQVTGFTGLLGRGNICYKWCCGYRVKLVFDHHGGVIVNYYGS